MGVAIIILVLVIAAAVVLGGGLYMLLARLRGKQLDPRENELAPSEFREQPERPEHVSVGNDEQRRRFVKSR